MRGQLSLQALLSKTNFVLHGNSIEFASGSSKSQNLLFVSCRWLKRRRSLSAFKRIPEGCCHCGRTTPVWLANMETTVFRGLRFAHVLFPHRKEPLISSVGYLRSCTRWYEVASHCLGVNVSNLSLTPNTAGLLVLAKH